MNKNPLVKLVAPSILSADFANLEREIKLIENAGADWVHVDVMDGHFVDNITIGPAVVTSLKKVTKLPLDVHLMIDNPEKYAEAFAKAGADYLTVHVETLGQDPVGLMQKIKSLGVKLGITLRPRTSLELVKPLLSLVDLVLIMTVEPGFSGQSFMPNQVFKIDECARIRSEKKYSYLIEVDGGINEETAKLCQNADVLSLIHI